MCLLDFAHGEAEPAALGAAELESALVSIALWRLLTIEGPPMMRRKGCALVLDSRVRLASKQCADSDARTVRGHESSIEGRLEPVISTTLLRATSDRDCGTLGRTGECGAGGLLLVRQFVFEGLSKGPWLTRDHEWFRLC